LSRFAQAASSNLLMPVIGIAISDDRCDDEVGELVMKDVVVRLSAALASCERNSRAERPCH
jgi:hypothetical protein